MTSALVEVSMYDSQSSLDWLDLAILGSSFIPKVTKNLRAVRLNGV